MTSSSGVTFVLFCFVFVFVEAATLRSIVLRYAGAPIATRVSFFFPFVLFRYVFFSSSFCAIAFSLCMESTSYVLFFRMVVFYLVTTGWMFDISLCENSISSINQNIFTKIGPWLYLKRQHLLLELP